MAVAVVFAVLASFLWAITNHIDKFLINGINEAGKSIKTLMVFSTLVAGVVFLPIWLVISGFAVEISGFSLIMILLAAIMNVFAMCFYFQALNKNDASVVIVMFQMIPVFAYILALIFFQETLTVSQLVGSAIILSSAVLISWDLDGKKSDKNKTKAFFLMMLSSLSYAIYYVLFNAATRESSYNSCAFYFQIGLILIGMVLIFQKKYRKPFLSAIKNNGKRYISLNVTNEVLNLVAAFLVNYAATIIPLALADILNGFQGAFVFILGALGTKFLPKYFSENLSKKAVMQKVACIALSIAGLVVMFV